MGKLTTNHNLKLSYVKIVSISTRLEYFLSKSTSTFGTETHSLSAIKIMDAIASWHTLQRWPESFDVSASEDLVASELLELII